MSFSGCTLAEALAAPARCVKASGTRPANILDERTPASPGIDPPDARPHSASLIERALVQVDTTTIVEWSGRRFDGIYIASENAELGGHYEWASQ